MNQEAVLIYDAECALCDKAVRGLRRGRKGGSLRCVAMGSDEAAQALERAGIDDVDDDTVILIDREGVHERSVALLRAAEITGSHARLGWLKFVPRRLRDSVYRIVARNRRRFPGDGPNRFAGRG